MKIHPSAVIGLGVELDKNIEVGPFAVIEGRVRVGSGTKIGSHAVIGSKYGSVEIGENNQILSGAVIGGPPQDLKYKNENTKLIVGSGNIFREFVTVNIGTETGGGETRIGNNCLLMSYVHVAHDCDFHNHVVVANSTQFAGHVICEDFSRVGGMCGVAQFVRVGKHAFVGGDSSVNKDVIPFSLSSGNYVKIRGTNKIGLDRAGYDKEEVEHVNRAIRLLIKGDRTLDEACSEIESSCKNFDSIKHLLNFVKTSKQGVAR